MLLAVVGGFAADYGFNVALGRLLDPAEFGDFKVAYAFGFLASVVVVLGGDRAAPSLLSADLARGDNRRVWEFLRFFSLLAFGISAILITVVMAASFLQVAPESFDRHHALVHIAFVVPFIAVGALLARLLQAAKFLASASIPWRIGFPVLKIALLGSLALVVGQVSLDQAIAAAALAVLLVCGWLWRRTRTLNLVELRRSPQLFDAKQALRTSAPMMVVMLLALGLAQTDIFMVEWLGDEAHVGHFAAAATTAHWVFLAQVTIIGVFAPLIAPAIAAGADAARRTFWRAQGAVTMAAALLATLLMLAAPQMLSLFGPEFTHGAKALRLLVLAYAVSCCTAPAAAWLQYSGKGRIAAAIGLAALVIDVAANYFAIPDYGVEGAATATLIAMSVAGIALSFAIAKHGYAPKLQA